MMEYFLHFTQICFPLQSRALQPKSIRMPSSVIVSAKRTPVGSFGGSLSSLSAPRLGAAAIKAAVQAAGLKPEQIEEVIMGNAIPAGEGQAPARQAMLYADLPHSTAAMTINKVCGSGLKAVMLADQAIRCGDVQVLVAGGMESMSNAPYAMPMARTGYRMGNGLVEDLMIKDGLWDPYNNCHMGNIGEKCAVQYGVSRQAQDEYARQSYERAQRAIKEGRFKDEIIAVEIPPKKGPALFVDTDEEPPRGKPEKFMHLKPVFDKQGTITAANASTINDGAAAVVVMSDEKARELNVKPLVKIVAHVQISQDPAWFSTAPAAAIKKVLHKASLKISDIDLWEINEAFAVVSLWNNNELKLPPERVNVNGGAVALGHPIGASGARILVTLIHELIKRPQAKRGMASLCIGGGEAVAMIVEKL